MSFGVSPEMTAELTKTLRQKTEKLLIMKLSPNVTNIEENHKSHDDRSRNRVNRSLSMKFRMQTTTKHLLKDAYPNLLKHSKY